MVNRCLISPDQLTVLSVGSEGAIFIWKVPEDVLLAKADKDMMEKENV